MADEACKTLLNLVNAWGKTIVATVKGTVHAEIATEPRCSQMIDKW